MQIDELQAIPLFASLPAEEQEIISQGCSATWVMKGKHIAKEGDFAYKFWAILSGTASVVSGDKAIADLKAGDVFGEMAMIEDDRRNADVVAGDDLHLATMLSWDFRSALDSCPNFKAAIDDIIASRS